MRKIYKFVYLLTTGYLALLLAFPILTGKNMDITILDDAIAIILWLVGAGLMFSKKYYKIGYLLVFMPILFILISIAFY